MVATVALSGCGKKESTPSLSVSEYQTAIRNSILNVSSYIDEEPENLEELSETMEKIKTEMENIEALSAPTQCKQYDETLKKSVKSMWI